MIEFFLSREGRICVAGSLTAQWADADHIKMACVKLAAANQMHATDFVTALHAQTGKRTFSHTRG